MFAASMSLIMELHTPHEKHKVHIATKYDQVEFKNIHPLANYPNVICAKSWIHAKIYPNNGVHFDEFLYFYISDKNHDEHLVISFL